jgi:UDP-GlcNAc3NAcA epimerase
MKIFTVVGARPQFVKAAVVSREINRIATAGEDISECLVHTGQHYDEKMSDIFFDEMRIPKPTHRLQIGGMSHGSMTGRMLEQLEPLMQAEAPDWVLVYGDTNSTLAGALAAAKMHIPVAHVEAGLRSFNRAMPEEINRVMTDHLSSLLLAPTDQAMRNLAAEGIGGNKVLRCGDVMYDASLYYSKLNAQSDLLHRLSVQPGKYFLATIHRAENVDDATRLAVIVEAMTRCSAELPVVWPIHPRTRKALSELKLLDGGRLENVRLIDPVGYLDMVQLEKQAAVILTDSGGVQKEAYFFEVPCVTIRHETEWVELVDCGANRLAPPQDVATIVSAVLAAMSPGRFPAKGLYGDGNCARAIVGALFDSPCDDAVARAR